MEVTISIGGNAELLFPATSISGVRTVTVTLIARIICQQLNALSDPHTLNHDLHQIMKTISFAACLHISSESCNFVKSICLYF